MADLMSGSGDARLLVALLLRRSLRLEHYPLVVLAGGVAGLVVAIRLMRSS